MKFVDILTMKYNKRNEKKRGTSLPHSPNNQDPWLEISTILTLLI